MSKQDFAMKPLLFLCVITFALVAMNRPSTPPILIERPSPALRTPSPDTPIHNYARQLSLHYEDGLASSPPKIMGLWEQLQCQKKIKEALEKELSEKKDQVSQIPNTSENRELQRQLYTEITTILFSIPRIEQTVHSLESKTIQKGKNND